MGRHALGRGLRERSTAVSESHMVIRELPGWIVKHDRQDFREVGEVVVRREDGKSVARGDRADQEIGVRALDVLLPASVVERCPRCFL
jgi:hypothetical protein